MQHLCEIMLAVGLIVVLGIWYYTAVYRSSCKTAAEATPSSAANHAATARPHTMMPSGSGLHASEDVAPENGMNDFSMTTPNGEAVTPAKTNSLVQKLGTAGFKTFDEAPKDVNPAMWPDRTSEPESNLAATILPGGAENAAQVHEKYANAQIAGHGLGTAYLSSDNGNRRNAKTLGAIAGIQMTTITGYMGVPDAQPQVDCSKISSHFLPSFHPCFEALRDPIEAEDEMRTNSAMAVGTITQR